MAKLSIRDLDVKGKRVLVRVDFNVPVEEGRVTDATRIEASIPTIRHIVDAGGRAVLMSHLGRPKGKIEPKYSLAPAARPLQELLGMPVKFLRDCVGPVVEQQVRQLQDGEVCLLENLRFHPGEESNDAEFSERLAALGDIYVNDAFGTAHRTHASTSGVARHFVQSAAGYLLEKEMEYLQGHLEKPGKPFLTILGGAKVSDKIQMIEELLPKLDALLIGGAMAYTFLKAMGVPVGNSRVEEDHFDTARDVLADAERRNVKLVLPTDHVVSGGLEDEAGAKSVDEIGEGMMGLDIGPKSVASFGEEIGRARTVVWNGPVGVFEKKAFENGTRRVAEFLAESEAVTIVGGGDTAAAVAKFGVAGRMTHVSTGGGASLKLLEGKELPAIASLTDKP